MKKPPPLTNDCFALPQGTNWTPVDEALRHLKSASKCLVGTEKMSAKDAIGRILATNIHAGFSSPPHANSAVDGYAINSKDLKKSGLISLQFCPEELPLGIHFWRNYRRGCLPIYTGAKMPIGADTVILQEDTVSENSKVSFYGPIKPGSNTRDLVKMLKKIH